MFLHAKKTTDARRLTSVAAPCSLEGVDARVFAIRAVPAARVDGRSGDYGERSRAGARDHRRRQGSAAGSCRRSGCGPDQRADQFQAHRHHRWSGALQLYFTGAGHLPRRRSRQGVRGGHDSGDRAGRGRERDQRLRAGGRGCDRVGDGHRRRSRLSRRRGQQPWVVRTHAAPGYAVHGERPAERIARERPGQEFQGGDEVPAAGGVSGNAGFGGHASRDAWAAGQQHAEHPYGRYGLHHDWSQQHGNAPADRGAQRHRCRDVRTRRIRRGCSISCRNGRPSNRDVR